MTIAELAPLLLHDCADESFRAPIGALPAGASVTLAFSDPAALVLDAELTLCRDGWESVVELGFENGRWFAELTLPETPAALWYRFTLHTSDGELFLCAGEGGRFGQLMSSPGEGFRLTVYDRDFRTPEWFKRAVMYQVFPDRFARDGSDRALRGLEYHRALGRELKFHESWDEAVDWLPNTREGFYFPGDFFGGTLRGIRERLPYLSALGVTVLYLNPIFEACSNHRYDAADYLRIDPILGTEEDFEDLCRAAGELGIRLMLDGVFSHTGADSVYFNKFGRYGGPGACQGRESPYFPWYDFRSFPGDYRCWWNFPDLPEVEETDPDWQDFVVTGRDSVVRTWLRRGAAGWRLDVADELPDGVLALIRAAAKAEDPETVILGEVWEDPVVKTSYGVRRDYALGASLDSVMNYPLRGALLDFFTFRSDSRALVSLLLSQRLNYPAPLYYSLMLLLGSHDTERLRTALATRLDPRALTREQQAGFLVSDSQDARGAVMQRLCAAVQFTLPGVPCVYYGDEAGMNGMLDPFCRAPFREGAHPLGDWYASLAALRRSSEALSVGAAAFQAPEPDVLCLLRCDGRDAFLVCVNRSGEEKRVVADLWLRNAGLTGAELQSLKAMALTGGREVVTGRELTVTGGLAELEAPPESVYIFRLS